MTDTNFSCRLSDGGDYVHVQMGHPVTIEMVRAVTAEAVRVAEGLRQDVERSCLVDVRGARTHESAARIYWFFREDLPKYPNVKMARIALVIDPTDETHQFVETTGLNAGYALRCFLGTEEAITWLREERPKPVRLDFGNRPQG